MSWWETGHGDDVIGDAPADIMQDTLRAIARDRETRGAERPTPHQLLEAIAAALRAESRDLLDDPELADRSRLVIRLEDAPAIAAEIGDAASGGPLVPSLRNAFEAIAREYLDRFGRKPRLAEVLETIAFVLGGQFESLLSGCEGQTLAGIAAEEAD